MVRRHTLSFMLLRGFLCCRWLASTLTPIFLARRVFATCCIPTLKAENTRHKKKRLVQVGWKLAYSPCAIPHRVCRE